MPLTDESPDVNDLPPALRFLSGGGEATRLILARDWAGHPLGPPEGWPDALKVSLSTILNSPESMILAWDAEALHFFFNETYFPLLGPRVSRAMGRPFSEVWADGWDQARPIIDEAFAGRSQRYIDLPWKLGVDRGPPETWFTFSYSRVLSADGEVAGLFILTNETTARVLADAATREAEERLRKEVERQRLSLQQMPGFTAALSGPRHVFDYVNDAYVGLAGDRDYIGRSVRDLFPDLEGQGFFELLDKVYATGEPFSARSLPVVLAHDSATRFVDLLYQPVRDDAGAVTGIFVGGYDVTEPVRAERRREALLRLDERLRDVAEAVDLSHAAAEILGEALGAARVGYGVLDIQAEAIVVERDWRAPGVSSVAGPHAFRDYGSYIDELRQGAAVANADVQVDPRTADRAAAFRAIGVRAHLDVPIIEQGRTVAQMFVHSSTPRTWKTDEIAFVRDFAERVRSGVARRLAEQELRHSEARLRELNADLERQVVERTLSRGRTWQLSPEILGVINADGFFETSNPAWRTVLGWSEAEVSASPFFRFVHPDDLAKTQAAWADALQRGLPALRFENRYRHKAGGWRWLSWVAVPEDGKVYCSARDVTAENAQAAELEEAHAQLRQSHKMEAVGQLTGGLAHDFNNLLAGISGSLELIGARLSQGRVQEVERYLTAAQGAARRAAALTHRLLAFARRQTLDPRPVDVNRLVAGMEELVRRSVGPAIEVEVVGAAGLWTALVDPPQLENALLNLCINARDAMPNGGRLTVETANKWLDAAAARQHDMPEGQYLSLCVTDTGTGMSPEVVAKAFDPFFTTKPLGEGTGLGLSMIYGFAKQSGGQVRIYSEVDEGTTVCIYLPRHLGAAEAPGSFPAPPACAAARAGETVLVVDDEPTVRMLVTDLLEEAGYNAVEAADSVAGLAMLQSDARIDLLVTDVGLPGGMNGRQMADAARVSRPDLKVLFITGYAENALLGDGRLEPGMAVLTKPFPVETLASRIRDMLAG